jgi:UDP-N-acetylmuramate--alanine ligase
VSVAHGLVATLVGEGPENDWRVSDLELTGGASTFTLTLRDRVLARVELAVPGRHYVLDAAAALVTGLHLGYRYVDLARGLGEFTGTGRRMEPKGEVGGVRVYDSYAHHPTEITGDLAAARSLAGDGRLVVAFQPHLVSRTRIFGPAMGAALGAADEVVVLDVYVAREVPDPGVTGRLVADAVPLSGDHVHYVPDLAGVAAVLARLARPGDLVLTLGAGSVTNVGPQVLALLETEDS